MNVIELRDALNEFIGTGNGEIEVIISGNTIDGDEEDWPLTGFAIDIDRLILLPYSVVAIAPVVPETPKAWGEGTCSRAGIEHAGLHAQLSTCFLWRDGGLPL